MRAWRWTTVSVTVCVAVLIVSGAAAPASVPASIKFSSKNREQSYKVPLGVVLLGVEAVGGYGDPDPTTSSNAVDLYAALPVTPGSTLYVEVGAGATGSNATFGGGGAGGAGDAAGGAGGGASDVRSCSMETRHCAGGGTTLSSRLVVAGGGGGEGGSEDPSHLFTNTCGENQQAGNAGYGSPIKTELGTVIPGESGYSSAGAAGGRHSQLPGRGWLHPSLLRRYLSQFRSQCRRSERLGPERR